MVLGNCISGLFLEQVEDEGAMLNMLAVFGFAYLLNAMPKKRSAQAEDEGPKAKSMYTLKLEQKQLDKLGDYLEADTVRGFITMWRIRFLPLRARKSMWWATRAES